MEETNRTILQCVPEKPDSGQRYLFYLHGLIVELAGIRPKSEEHGYYEYELILEEFAKEGFVVISEARKRDTHVKHYAEYLVSQIKILLDNGVPPEHIAVVGASKGGIIAAYTSLMLQDMSINYVFLAGLFEKCLVDENLKLYGNVLSIHDRSDNLGISPQLYFQRSEGLGHFESITLDLDNGHGMIYKPYREWVAPMVTWLTSKEPSI